MPECQQNFVDLSGGTILYWATPNTTALSSGTTSTGIGRGEFGLFVTTSRFTSKCQEEVIGDGYPVELVRGLRLVQMLRADGLLRNDRLTLD